jgi:hypothetical protein
MKAVTEKLSAARDYIGLSWLAFVLSSTKMPIANCQRCRMEHTTPAQMEACECLTCHGFYAGTLDLARVEEMLRLHPNGLLAKRTGAVSGTVVVDVDAPHGIPTMRQLLADGLLPRTIVQRTGSDGYHLVYKHPGAGMRIMSGAGKGGLGVDIKADDAYVVVAPSAHPRTRQRYQWIGSFSGEPTSLPEYWVERLREPERPARTSRLPLQSVTGSRYAAGALRRQLAELLDAPEGTRNDTLNKSAFALGQFVGAGMLEEKSTAAVLEDVGQRIGLAPGEVRRSVASGLRAGARHPRAGQP